METVQTDKMITLEYRMTSRFPDGTVKAHPEERHRFIFGVDRQVPSMEKALEGCEEGRKGRVHVPASELYGEHDDALIREIPKKGLIKQRLRAGQFYRQMKMGTLVAFKVLEVRDQTVLADFNRPMSGIRVSIDFEVLEIRDAGRDEIDAAMEHQMRKSIGCD